MRFINFRNKLNTFKTFNLTDIRKLENKFYYRNLIEWQKKGYIRRIANGTFIFSDINIDDSLLFYLSNKIYQPSYISMEAALSYYGFIPETLYHITGISTKKTNSFNFENINYSYRNIQRKYFYGYNLLKTGNYQIKIAEPEKALIDYFYLNPHLSTIEQIHELRFNSEIILEKINRQKFEDHEKYYNNKRLTKRLNLLKKVINYA